MNEMKMTEIIRALLGVVAGLYVGVWIFFIGGIIQIVSAVQIFGPGASMNIALGTLRMIFGAPVGYLVAIAVFSPKDILRLFKFLDTGR